MSQQCDNMETLDEGSNIEKELLEVKRMELRSGKSIVTCIDMNVGESDFTSPGMKNLSRPIESGGLYSRGRKTKSIGKENEKPGKVLEETIISTPVNRKRTSTNSTGDSTGKKRRLSMRFKSIDVEDCLLTNAVAASAEASKIESSTDVSLVPASDEITDVLNTTFEVAEEDSFLLTPARKRSVRFAQNVEMRRLSQLLPDTGNITPETNLTPKSYVTPVVRCSSTSKLYTERICTPHPSSKKRPSSILKNSSVKKGSALKTSQQKTGSSIKIPDFNSIHKAQFEKMESLYDFHQRRQKCVRKLDHQPFQSRDARSVTSTSASPAAPKKSKIPKFQSQQPSVNCSASVGFSAVKREQQQTNTQNELAISSTSFKKTHFAVSLPAISKTTGQEKPKKMRYEQARNAVMTKQPTSHSRGPDATKSRNLLKGVRLNRRFELQMKHRNISIE